MCCILFPSICSHHLLRMVPMSSLSSRISDRWMLFHIRQWQPHGIPQWLGIFYLWKPHCQLVQRKPVQHKSLNSLKVTNLWRSRAELLQRIITNLIVKLHSCLFSNELPNLPLKSHKQIASFVFPTRYPNRLVLKFSCSKFE